MSTAEAVVSVTFLSLSWTYDQCVVWKSLRSQSRQNSELKDAFAASMSDTHSISISASDLFASGDVVTTCGSIQVQLPALSASAALLELAFKDGLSVELSGATLQFHTIDAGSNEALTTTPSATTSTTPTTTTTTPSTVSSSLPINGGAASTSVSEPGSQQDNDMTIIVAIVAGSVVAVVLMGVIAGVLVARARRPVSVMPIQSQPESGRSARKGNVTSGLGDRTSTSPSLNLTTSLDSESEPSTISKSKSTLKKKKSSGKLKKKKSTSGKLKLKKKKTSGKLKLKKKKTSGKLKLKARNADAIADANADVDADIDTTVLDREDEGTGTEQHRVEAGTQSLGKSRTGREVWDTGNGNAAETDVHQATETILL